MLGSGMSARFVGEFHVSKILLVSDMSVRLVRE